VSALARRLLTAGAAYQLPDVAAKAIAVGLLPVYTRQLTPADYGTAELVLTLVIVASIVVRLGLAEALVRFHFHDADPERRIRLARTATGALAVTTTLAAGAAALAAEPLAELVLGAPRAAEVRAGALGLWAFTNLEVAYALLRVDERLRAYLTASLANVALTVGLTLWLVVGRDEGAVGLLVGNFAASALVLLALWVALRERLGLRPRRVDRPTLARMLRFGLPTVPAEVAVFALFVIDRIVLYRAASPEAAGLYAVSVKLAAVVVVLVRAFQLAWPPLAHSIGDDATARRVFARVASALVVLGGLLVAGLALLGRWLVQALAGPAFLAAHEALPFVGLGWALYGLSLVLVAIAARAHAPVRTVPAALLAVVVNVALLAALVGPLAHVGAGLALAGACAVMVGALAVLVRPLLGVAFEWGRMGLAVAVMATIAAAGELLLPASGLVGFAARAAALAAIVPALWAVGVVRPGELAAARRGLSRLRHGPVAPAHG